MSTDESTATLSERSRRFFETINQSCLRRIDRVSVPILGVQDDQIRHDRTGVLYRVANDHFILTAAHSLQKIVEANIPLYVSMNKPGVTPVPLCDARFHWTEDVVRDFAAIWLPPETVQEIVQHKDFLSRNQFD